MNRLTIQALRGLFLFCGLFAAALLAPWQARAATDTTTMAVSATVISTCSVTTSPLAFGNYSSGAVNTTTPVLVTCSNGTTYTVGLSAGGGTGATVAVRKLVGPSAATLNYSIYSDAAHTTVWGSTIGTDTVAGTGNGLAQTLTAYGRIPASQTSSAGAYTDTVTVTLTY